MGKETEVYEDLKKFMKTPQDLTSLPNEEKADTLALHFIGYLAKPLGIDNIIYKRCLEAFNNNRGKTEKEADAILKVLEGKNG